MHSYSDKKANDLKFQTFSTFDVYLKKNPAFLGGS